jgi:hypothetical protein
LIELHPIAHSQGPDCKVIEFSRIGQHRQIVRLASKTLRGCGHPGSSAQCQEETYAVQQKGGYSILPDSGIRRLRALAAVRLITRSNLVGCANRDTAQSLPCFFDIDQTAFSPFPPRSVLLPHSLCLVNEPRAPLRFYLSALPGPLQDCSGEIRAQDKLPNAELLRAAGLLVGRTSFARLHWKSCRTSLILDPTLSSGRSSSQSAQFSHRGRWKRGAGIKKLSNSRSRDPRGSLHKFA